MSRIKRSPLGYIFMASLMPTCLLLMYYNDIVGKEHVNYEVELEVLAFFSLFFFILSVIWDYIGMITLVAKAARLRLAVGALGLLYQFGVYYWLWQLLARKIGDISFQ